MSRPDLASFVRQHADPLALALGLEIWGIEVLGGNHPVVRLYVEALASATESGVLSNSLPTDAVCPDPACTDADFAEPGDGTGVGIEQCAELSRALGLALEVADPFADAWTLEVSSPGFDRLFFTLPQLAPYTGRELELTLSAPLPEWPGRKKFRGVLDEVGETSMTLELDLHQRRADESPHVVLPWDHVRRARLVHVFVEPEKPGKGKDSGKARAAEPDADKASGTKKKKRGPKIHDELD